MTLRHRRYGIHEISWAVYSSADYWFEVPGPDGEWAAHYNFLRGMAALQMLALPGHTPHPLVVDPTWPHSVTLLPGELSAFLQAWQAAPTWTEIRFGSLELSSPSQAYQKVAARVLRMDAYDEALKKILKTVK